MPVCGFQGVTAYLKKDESLMRALKIPSRPLTVEMVTVPGLATMCTSCIVKDKMTGITYMDTVTTSIGRVALSGPEQETSSQGSIIEDVTDLQ